ncbi:hypothetical protein FIM63_00560 [Helicobacter pylori]|nr:hypothetical protein FIM63_00560 [Helicobacter pylori]
MRFNAIKDRNRRHALLLLVSLVFRGFKKLCFYQDQYYWDLTLFGLKNFIFKKWVFVLLF